MAPGQLILSLCVLLCFSLCLSCFFFVCRPFFILVLFAKTQQNKTSGPSLLGYLKRCCILGNPERREEETSNDIVNPNNQDSPGNHEETIDDLINSTESVGSLAELERRNALRERHRRLLVDTFLPRKVRPHEYWKRKHEKTKYPSRQNHGEEIIVLLTPPCR